MADDDFREAIRRLRLALTVVPPRFPAGAFRLPGWPSPDFFRHATEIEQQLRWCEQHRDDPRAAEILHALSFEVGIQPPSPPVLKPPPPAAAIAESPADLCGALTVTQAAQTLTSAAAVTAGATLGVTQANETLAAAANVTVLGTLGAAQANETLAAAANVTVLSTLDVTQAANTLSAVGGVSGATTSDGLLAAVIQALRDRFPPDGDPGRRRRKKVRDDVQTWIQRKLSMSTYDRALRLVRRR